MSDAHGPETTAATLAALSRWIDEHPANAARDREAALWGRLAKVTEEAGEVVAALIAVTGQNPRKPASGSMADVEKELLDVAVTALAAVEHLRGNDGGSLGALDAHVAALAVRAGLVRLTPASATSVSTTSLPDITAPEEHP